MRCATLALVFALSLLPGRARAVEPGGAITGYGVIGAGSLVRGAPELGGGGMGDLLFGPGPLRLGGGLGTWFVNDRAGGRLVSPLAFSGSLHMAPRPVGLTLRLRAGLATGANADGFYAAGYGAVGTYVDFRVDDVISIGVGADISFLLGNTGRTDFMPGIVLSFTPRAAP